MTIDSTDNKKFIINNQNKTIEFLYKEQAQFVETINEIKADKEVIFNWIAELYDKIEEGEIETQEILEELANIQQYAK